eukprot:182133-Hanusia_phi.AAC.1
MLLRSDEVVRSESLAPYACMHCDHYSIGEEIFRSRDHVLQRFEDLGPELALHHLHLTRLVLAEALQRSRQQPHGVLVVAVRHSHELHVHVASSRQNRQLQLQ